MSSNHRFRELHDTANPRPGWFVTGLMAVISIAFVLMVIYTEPIGDDLHYMSDWWLFGGIKGYPRWAFAHWINSNGRLPNYLLPPMLSLPHVIVAVADGVMLFVFMYMTLRLSRVGTKHVALGMMLIAIIVFSYPWWDSSLLQAVIFNYILASAWGLLWLWLWLGPERKGWWAPLLYVFSLSAGALHEALSLPVAIALAIYIISAGGWRKFTRQKLLMYLCFIVGMTICVFSYALIYRIMHSIGVAPDDPMWLLVLKSDTWVLVMLVLTLPFTTSNRRRFAVLARTDWIVYFIAAVLSMCISAVGGIVGRSGWFACTFALIAIFRWLSSMRLSMPRAATGLVTVILTAVIIVHYAMLVVWQKRVGTELQQTLQLYRQSADGVVYYDYTLDNEIPWWLLHKNRGVIDPDDFYLHETVYNTYGDSIRHLVILPVLARDIDVSADSVDVGMGYITKVRPDADDRNLFLRGGKEYVAQRFVRDSLTLYYITPRDCDPGDR